MTEELNLTSPAKIMTADGAVASIQRRTARVRNMIAVASGKGGVGKTWFSITLAHTFAHLGDRVLLVDGDLGLANVDVQLAIAPERDLASVVAGRVALSAAITSFSGGARQMTSSSSSATNIGAGFDVLAGRSGSGSLDNMSRKQIEKLCSELATISMQYDHVIIDLAAGMNSHMAPLFAMTGKLLVVATDDPTSITDAYACIKLLATRHTDLDIRVVVNMADGQSEAERTYGSLSRACGHFLNITPKMAGYIVRDKHVSQAIRAQSPLLTRYPQSTAGKNVQLIAETLRLGGPRGLV